MANATAPALRIGFVGFGEAAFHIAKGLRLAKGLRQAGLASLVAFDIRVTEQIRQRARETETHLIGTNRELAESSDVLLSAVTADQALNAARQNAPYLSAQHIYADLNSVSPGVKQSVARVIEGCGARFAEIAMMAPVPPYGHKVPMLAGGAGAPDFIDRLAPFGISAEIVSREVGTASATKMFRSIMVKGMEALITECVLGATPYRADERVFASLAETFPGIDWKKLADYMLGRVVVHGERRAREMEEVAATLRETGVEPIMADAIVRRMDWSVEAGLKQLFGGEAPKSYRDVVDAVSKKPVGAD
jgi:3-hydroxyisobutyrate dehydrogenase-like beta-hydroxyacid dehydrogenase